jgi:hypothetical protein
MSVWIKFRIAGKEVGGSSVFSTSIMKGACEAQMTGGLEGTGLESAVTTDDIGRFTILGEVRGKSL